jgi:ABC-2 type transport system permease protein
MQQSSILLVARQFWRHTFHSGIVLPLLGLFCLLLTYATFTGWKTYQVQNNLRKHYQAEVRHEWEESPDKHPHRMAHYGYLVFRIKHPLSVFDYGLESYTGNAVFLEAHRQNTANFSEASFSTSLLRFGDISMAMLLQVVLPLMLFFLGFNSITSEREQGTLKILFSQGLGWKELLLGKALGLLSIAGLFFLPVVLTLLFLTAFAAAEQSQNWLRLGSILGFYGVFIALLSLVAVWVSAYSSSSKTALVRLIGLWLLWAIVLPRSTQALGNYWHPSPSKVEFEAQVEQDLIKEGDSHNPDDPHYKAIKDSLLAHYKVDSVQQLPFNYSGFIMSEGERISAEIYNRHWHKLLQVYTQQNQVAELSALLNPFMALKNLSMGFAGTDFHAYVDFQQQAENFRYQLAQRMNRLQMRYISNQKLGPRDKPYQISRKHWREMPDWQYQNLDLGQVFQQQTLSILALLFWPLALWALLLYSSKKLRVI